MDLKSLTTDQLAAEIAHRKGVVSANAEKWHKAQEATKAARRAETPLRNDYYEQLGMLRLLQAEHNRREDILNGGTHPI